MKIRQLFNLRVQKQHKRLFSCYFVSLPTSVQLHFILFFAKFSKTTFVELVEVWSDSMKLNLGSGWAGGPV